MRVHPHRAVLVRVGAERGELRIHERVLAEACGARQRVGREVLALERGLRLDRGAVHGGALLGAAAAGQLVVLVLGAGTVHQEGGRLSEPQRAVEQHAGAAHIRLALLRRGAGQRLRVQQRGQQAELQAEGATAAGRGRPHQHGVERVPCGERVARAQLQLCKAERGEREPVRELEAQRVDVAEPERGRRAGELLLRPGVVPLGEQWEGVVRCVLRELRRHVQRARK